MNEIGNKYNFIFTNYPYLDLCKLTAANPGLSCTHLSKSGSADLDFPNAKYTVALLK